SSAATTSSVRVATGCLAGPGPVTSGAERTRNRSRTTYQISMPTMTATNARHSPATTRLTQPGRWNPGSPPPGARVRAAAGAGAWLAPAGFPGRSVGNGTLIRLGEDRAAASTPPVSRAATAMSGIQRRYILLPLGEIPGQGEHVVQHRGRESASKGV